jgi:azurin
MTARIRSLCVLVACALAWCASAAEKLELKKGDHIAIIGNTLADRMQHSGYFEALVYQQFPKHELVFRNLGFSADELATRPRSENFGSPEDWLTRAQADVVLAFFGYNESFKGEAGVEKFRADLEKFIADTKKANYSSKGSPRLVLFSPIAAEKHRDPNFPDPAPINKQLEPYVKAMREVAQANGVQFVDLFNPSQKAYSASKQSLTINGVHLSDDGYKAIAPAMFEQTLGEKAPAMDSTGFENLRAAINEKNAVWFSRYRTVDGYNVYGGRSALAYEPGKGPFITDRNAKPPHVSNYKVMQQEMTQRDVMTANRDKRVWAVAQGSDLAVKDDNLPPVEEVKSNKPGQNPDGSHVFLSGEEAMKHIKVPPGCKLQFIASEKEFPELVKPVQMAFDTKGRLWVAAWKNYPERTPTSKDGDKLLVFDLNADGSVKKMTTFIDDLNCPTGFQFYKDGVLVMQAPDLWFVRDTDGDGKADSKVRVLNGMDSADSHHTANAICYEPGGAIYLSDGTFHRTSVETATGPIRNINGAIYRYEPRTGKFERHVPYGFANPHGRVFDAWGNDIVTDATGNANYFGPAFSGYLESGAHSSMNTYWRNPSRPCPATAMLSSRHFPEEMQGEFLNINVIGFQGIFRVKNTDEGSGLLGTTVTPPMLDNDNAANPNFRPIAADVAPDGSLYVLDWANAIIGHMQHHLRDPNRDKIHGRIYRITYPERPLLKPVPIDGQPIAKLLEALKEPEDNVRTRAKIELDKHPTKEVIAAVQKWSKQFKPTSVADAHHLLEALWVHQWHNVVNEDLLNTMLKSPEPRARAQAVRVLGYWRDRVSKPLDKLRVAANDPAPRVRLEAVRVASFFTGDEAMEVAYQITKFPMDYYLNYTFKETTKQLSKSVKNFTPKDPALMAGFASRMSDKELLAAPATEPILLARLDRKTFDVNTRSAALDELAKLRKSDRAREIIAALQRLDQPDAPLQPIDHLALLLTAMPDDAQKVRADLQRLSSDTHQPAIRRAANAALVSADRKPDASWSRTAGNAGARVLLIESIGMLIDPSLRAQFQPLLAAAITDANTSPEVRAAALRALPLMGNDNAAKNFQLVASQMQGGNVSSAAVALRKFPRDTWAKEQAPVISTAILDWAKKVPAGKRTEQQFVETVQVGMDVATLLPAAESARVRRDLLDLGVSVFAVKTVREQMRYDVSRLVVEAGKPFEIIFENDDMMPHNLVVVQPGAREEIGPVVDKMQPTQLDKQGRPFLPSDKKLAAKVIGATKLVEPGQKEVLKLVAPKKVGDYDFVCTFPEHWKVMFGKLIVVKDKEALLQASAAPAPAQQAAAAHEHNH